MASVTITTLTHYRFQNIAFFADLQCIIHMDLMINHMDLRRTIQSTSDVFPTLEV